jgi:probable HAF family extracellular repeat protein
VTKLGTLGFGYISQAMDISNQGVIVGSGWAGSSLHAIRWNGTAATDIGTLGGSSSDAWGINESGQIAGSAAIANDDGVHAARWDASTVVDLGTLGGTNSDAKDINENGQVVGSSALSGDEVTHAVLWSADGVASDLGSLTGDSLAYNLNNLGQVVGWSTGADENPIGTLWENGQIIDLNTYMPADLLAEGWFIHYGMGINDDGVIVAQAFKNGAYNAEGNWATVMLTPTSVPIPTAIWLFGSALVGLVGVSRRKKLAF